MLLRSKTTSRHLIACRSAPLVYLTKRNCICRCGDNGHRVISVRGAALHSGVEQQHADQQQDGRQHLSTAETRVGHGRAGPTLAESAAEQPAAR